MKTIFFLVAILFSIFIICSSTYENVYADNITISLAELSPNNTIRLATRFVRGDEPLTSITFSYPPHDDDSEGLYYYSYVTNVQVIQYPSLRLIRIIPPEENINHNNNNNNHQILLRRQIPDEMDHYQGSQYLQDDPAPPIGADYIFPFQRDPITNITTNVSIFIDESEPVHMNTTHYIIYCAVKVMFPEASQRHPNFQFHRLSATYPLSVDGHFTTHTINLNGKSYASLPTIDFLTPLQAAYTVSIVQSTNTTNLQGTPSNYDFPHLVYINIPSFYNPPLIEGERGPTLTTTYNPNEQDQQPNDDPPPRPFNDYLRYKQIGKIILQLFSPHRWSPRNPPTNTTMLHTECTINGYTFRSEQEDFGFTYTITIQLDKFVGDDNKLPEIINALSKPGTDLTIICNGLVPRYLLSAVDMYDIFIGKFRNPITVDMSVTFTAVSAPNQMQALGYNNNDANNSKQKSVLSTNNGNNNENNNNNFQMLQDIRPIERMASYFFAGYITHGYAQAPSFSTSTVIAEQSKPLQIYQHFGFIKGEGKTTKADMLNTALITFVRDVPFCPTNLRHKQNNNNELDLIIPQIINDDQNNINNKPDQHDSSRITYISHTVFFPHLNLNDVNLTKKQLDKSFDQNTIFSTIEQMELLTPDELDPITPWRTTGVPSPVFNAMDISSSNNLDKNDFVNIYNNNNNNYYKQEQYNNNNNNNDNNNNISDNSDTSRGCNTDLVLLLPPIVSNLSRLFTGAGESRYNGVPDNFIIHQITSSDQNFNTSKLTVLLPLGPSFQSGWVEEEVEIIDPIYPPVITTEYCTLITTDVTKYIVRQDVQVEQQQKQEEQQQKQSQTKTLPPSLLRDNNNGVGNIYNISLFMSRLVTPMLPAASAAKIHFSSHKKLILYMSDFRVVRPHTKSISQQEQDFGMKSPYTDDDEYEDEQQQTSLTLEDQDALEQSRYITLSLTFPRSSVYFTAGQTKASHSDNCVIAIYPAEKTKNTNSNDNEKNNNFPHNLSNQVNSLSTTLGRPEKTIVLPSNAIQRLDARLKPGQDESTADWSKWNRLSIKIPIRDLPDRKTIVLTCHNIGIRDDWVNWEYIARDDELLIETVQPLFRKLVPDVTEPPKGTMLYYFKRNLSQTIHFNNMADQQPLSQELLMMFGLILLTSVILLLLIALAFVGFTLLWKAGDRVRAWCRRFCCTSSTSRNRRRRRRNGGLQQQQERRRRQRRRTAATTSTYTDEDQQSMNLNSDNHNDSTIDEQSHTNERSFNSNSTTPSQGLSLQPLERGDDYHALKQ